MSKMEAKAHLDKNIMYIISVDVRAKCLNVGELLTINSQTQLSNKRKNSQYTIVYNFWVQIVQIKLFPLTKLKKKN